MQGRRVAVIGAGIVGVTSAYELAAQGFEVTVFERRGSVAEETSFANSGLIAPSYITPWAAPKMPRKLLASAFKRHPAMALRLPFGTRELSWLNKWRKHCEPRSFALGQRALRELATQSQERLSTLMAEEAMELEVRNSLLVLARSIPEWESLQARGQSLSDLGLPFELLDAQGARKVERALNPDTELVGALHLPGESSVNCRQFAGLLRHATRRYDVQWRFDTTVLGLIPGQPAHLESQTEHYAPQLETFDHIILCAGVPSSQLLTPLGLRLPMMEVRGYSISAPVREPLNAPFATVLDERHQVVISRLENRVRVSGICEIGGQALILSEQRLNTLYQILNDWFPGAAITSGAVQQWKGARHALPDGLPVIGHSGLAGIWLNLGHGGDGWALACGSAMLLSEQVQGIGETIDLSAFQVQRLQ